MKIIYSALKYDYMKPKQGFSFEHNNIYSSLREIKGIDLIYFPYDEILQSGKEKFNDNLLELVKKEKPDIFFAVMFTDELKFGTLDEIKKYTTSLAWFCDDHWRFDNYSKYYAPHFSWVATTYSKTINKYLNISYKNAVHTQWAANTNSYKPSANKKDVDVSFIGVKNKEREKIIKSIKKSGINVEVWGSGWPNGRINQEKMIELISRSKISLGLNPPSSYIGIKPLARLFFRRSGYLIIPDFWNFFNNIREWLQKRILMIKARIFEIPACKTMLITQKADNLNDYYEINKEIVTYDNIDDLIKKIKYYLLNELEREKITEAGYKRTISEHTYKKRFKDIFRKIGILDYE